MPNEAVILLVEDRKDDVLLVQRALLKANITNPVYVVEDGEQAMAYLGGTGPYADRANFTVPDLVLLDLKMPKMDGFEVLRWIRQQPGLKALRVIVLTSSEDIFDINRAYELGANSFLVKPLEFINYPAMMRTLGSFWLRYSEAPKLVVAAPSTTSSSADQNLPA